MEHIPVQPFHQAPKSEAVLLKDLDQCASTIAECEHTAGIYGEMEFQFNDCGQVGIVLAKICDPACQIDRRTPGKIEHKPSKPVGAWP